MYGVHVYISAYIYRSRGESPSFLLTPAWAYGCWLSQSRSYQTLAPHLESFRALFHLMVATEWGKLGGSPNLLSFGSKKTEGEGGEVTPLWSHSTHVAKPDGEATPQPCSSSHSPHRILLGTLDYLKEIHSGYRFCVKVLNGILPFLWACNSDMQRCVYKNVHCVIICRREKPMKITKMSTNRESDKVWYIYIAV